MHPLTTTLPENALVLDLRPAEDFARGHLPGALHLDLWGVSLIDTDDAPLNAFMWMIGHLFSLRGVTLERPVVVYEKDSGIREYYGEAVRARRGGAIPGAVHLEWTNNLQADGRFKPEAELRAMYEALGVTPDREVMTYCQGGYRAAHAYLALRILGYPNVRNYTGSWKEWGDRVEAPIEIVRRPAHR
jgi:3-mercaptopyruvate sulfurtransferase SseA